MNDKLQAALDAVDRLRGWAGQNGDDDAEAVSNALETQAAVIEFLVLNMPVSATNGATFARIIGRMQIKDEVIAAAFKAVEEAEHE